MALTKATGGVSLASTLPPSTSMITGFLAGEAITAGDLITLNASNAWVKVAAGGTPELVCMALTTASSGEALTGFHDVMVRYGDALPINSTRALFIDAALAGGISNTGIADEVPLGFIIDAQRIWFRGGVRNNTV